MYQVSIFETIGMQVCYQKQINQISQVSDIQKAIPASQNARLARSLTIAFSRLRPLNKRE